MHYSIAFLLKTVTNSVTYFLWKVMHYSIAFLLKTVTNCVT